MRSFKVTIEIDDDTVVVKRRKAHTLGELLNSDNDLVKENERGYEVIPASRIICITEWVNGKKVRVY